MRTLLKKIKEKRSIKNFSIFVAESCTGGMLSNALTSVSGSSEFFKGGIVAYSNILKIDLLGVPKSKILKYGAVSHQTAELMVKGLCKVSKSEILVSITGVAGPKGGSKKTPVGCVFFGVGTKINKKYKYKTIRKQFKSKTRRKLQQESTNYALQLINTEITKI